MAITNGYTTLTLIKHADVLNFANTNHDATLESAIEAISRSIDNYCGQHFYSANETRYYTATDSYLLKVDPISTSSGLLIYSDNDGDGVYENTWAATDYELLPYNAVTDGWPFTKIETKLMGANWFPSTRKGVKITATFGWAAVPAPIKEACKFQAERLFKLYLVPLGQATTGAVGEMLLKAAELPDDVKRLIPAAYRKLI